MQERVLDYGRWETRLDELAAVYRGAEPFPHVVLDDFLVPAAADRVLAEFPAVTDGEWIHYRHVNENKHGMTDREAAGPAAAAVMAELLSARFVGLLERLTGLPALLADPSLEGGGLQQSERGGFLNVHADFTVHPHRPDWRRRVNVLLYLNPNWDDAWGGQLELWDRSMSRCVRRVSPQHNRVVIFGTDETTFHGHPDPLACPERQTRKSVALYYFSAERVRPVARSTEYRPRPGDGAQALFIHADTLALRAYDRIKRRFGFDDRVISRVLGALSRLRPGGRPRR
jgi:hypothetical protein